MEETLEKLIYLTTKQFNLTEEEAKAMLTDAEGKLLDTAADVILEKDKERVKKLKEAGTALRNEGYSAAEKKFKNIAEETFKSKTGYTGQEETFEAKFDAWLADFKEKNKAKKEITDDDIKKHALYIALEAERVPKTDYEKLQSEYETFKSQSTRKQVMDVVAGRAWDVVAKKNPILSENATIAENRKRDFLRKFEGYNYQLQDEKILIEKDDKRLEDDHGNPKLFEDFVLELAEMNFEFQKQEEKGNAGNKDKGGAVVVTEKPTTKAEYSSAMNKYNGSSEEDAKTRIALTKYYNENKKD